MSCESLKIENEYVAWLVRNTSWETVQYNTKAAHCHDTKAHLSGDMICFHRHPTLTHVLADSLLFSKSKISHTGQIICFGLPALAV